MMYISSELRQLSEKQKVPVDLDTYIKKLANSRKRVLLVNDILHNVQVTVDLLTSPANLADVCMCSRYVVV